MWVELTKKATHHAGARPALSTQKEFFDTFTYKTLDRKADEYKKRKITQSRPIKTLSEVIGDARRENIVVSKLI